MKRQIGMVLALWIGGVSTVAAAPIVALGASNTEGKGRGRTPDGVPRSQAYPAQLERLLNQQGCRVKVQNAGVAGDTTRRMLSRLKGVLAKDTKVVILQPGGNDARRGESSDSSSNVAAMKSMIAAHGAKVVMLESLGRLARPYQLPDGQHYSAEGHAIFANHLLSQVRATGVCG